MVAITTLTTLMFLQDPQNSCFVLLLHVPQKKKCIIAKPNVQPGKARAYLEVNFSVMPESKRDLKNGHIFYLYTSFGKSLSETEGRLSSHFSLSDEEGYSFGAVNSRVRSLVNRRTLFKFKKLCNPKELGTFMNICDGTFKLPEGSQHISVDDVPLPDAQDPESLTSAEIQVPIFQDTEDMGDDSHSLHPPLNLAAASPESSLTLREQKMKKRLNFMSRSKVALARKYHTDQ